MFIKHVTKQVLTIINNTGSNMRMLSLFKIKHFERSAIKSVSYESSWYLLGSFEREAKNQSMNSDESPMSDFFRGNRIIMVFKKYET